MVESPFQHLLPEILSQIFLECLPNTDEDEIPTPSVSDAPLKLGHICFHWRQVSQSMSRLWSRLEIEVGGSHDVNSIDAFDSRMAKVTEMYMSMSRNRPLSIALRSHAMESLAMVTKALVKHASRWESVKLEASSLAIAPFLAALKQGVLLLKTLEIVLLQGDGSGNNIEMDLELVPHLSHAQLLQGIYSLKTPPFPLTSIRSLIATYHPDGLLNWIRHCPAVEELSLWFAYSPDEFLAEHEDSIDICELPCLSSLTLECANGNADSRPMQALLTSIHTPALRSLSLFVSGIVHNTAPLPAPLGSHLHNFIQRTPLPLESLTIVSPKEFTSQYDLLGILAQTSSLRHLSLCHEMATNAVIKALMYSTPLDAEGLLCPQLRSLEYSVSSKSSMETLVKMILSRYKTKSIAGKDIGSAASSFKRLEEVSITFYYGVIIHPWLSLMEDPDIAACIAQGLKLNVDMCNDC